MDLSYWQKQDSTKPLHPEIQWSRPEQRSRAGKIAIIGGNKLGFAAVASSYSQALQAGVGEVRVLLPDALKKTVPNSIGDAIFAPTNNSGGLSSEAAIQMDAVADWASGVLLIGDAGRNSETAILYERFLSQYSGQLTITRDAFELVRQDASRLVDRPNTLLVLSFAQLQKLFQLVYYPKILTFNMQLLQIVEALHKFTTTYKVSIVTFHKDNLIVSSDGRVTTQQWHNPISIWRGEVATKMAVYWLWNEDQAFEAYVTSLVDESR